MINSRGIASIGLGFAVIMSAGCGSPSADVGEALRVADAVPLNIIWIVADGLRESVTGHVTALADAGTSFTNLAIGASGSRTERSALLTGVSPATFGLTDDVLSATPPPGVAVLPLELRRAGYYTSRSGRARHNLLVGVGDNAWGSAAGPPGLLGAWDAAGPEADWRGRLVDWESPCTVSFGCGGAGVDRSRPFFALFNLAASDSETTDQEIGTILAALEEDGLANDTAVFVIGLNADHRLVIARRPGASDAGTSRDEQVSVIDLAATTLALAGVPIPAHMTGRVLIGGSGPVASKQSYRVAAADALPPWRAPKAGLPPTAATPAGYPTGGLFHVAPRVQLSCDTEEGTLVYTTELEAPFYWRLYTGPFRMRFWTLRFQCGRLGYRNSKVVTYDFDIE